MSGWGFEPASWVGFHDWLVDSTDAQMHETQGIGGLRAGLRHQRGLALTEGDQAWLTRGATAHATQLALLDRIHEAAHDEVLVLKGPEVACCYPEPAWRTSSDLDLFAVDAPGLWEALVAAGFAPTEAVGRHDRHHHLVPLHLPGFRLGVEVHRALGWPKGAVEPTPAVIVADAVASRSDDRFRTLSPELAFAHQLQHAWHGVPYGTLRDVVDLAALWDQADPDRLEPLLAQTSLTRLHHSTRRFGRAAVGGIARDASPMARVVARPSLRREAEKMHFGVVRRVGGLVDAAGLRFAARSVAHDARRVASRRG